MQTENRLLDDLARMANGALNTLSGLREEIESRVRERVERMLADMDMVPREEFEAVQAMAQTARAEQEDLAARVAELERRLGRAAARVSGAAAAEPRRVVARPGAAATRVTLVRARCRPAPVALQPQSSFWQCRRAVPRAGRRSRRRQAGPAPSDEQVIPGPPGAPIEECAMVSSLRPETEEPTGQSRSISSSRSRSPTNGRSSGRTTTSSRPRSAATGASTGCGSAGIPSSA